MSEPTTGPMTPPWVIVGCGRLGSALAHLADDIGIEVRAAWDRDGPPQVPAEQRLSGPLERLATLLEDSAVFVTVTDSAISSVAALLAGHCADSEVVVHCSGSISSGVLREAGVAAPVGSVHPLLSVADPREAARRMGDAAWTVEGSRAAVWWARGWLSRIDVEPREVDPDAKALYHAAAVASSGLVVGLIDAAFELADRAGLSRAEAREMLLPLARSTIANLSEMEPQEALTGPVARGDDAVVSAHVEAIDALGDENLSQIYRSLTLRTQRLAGRAETAGPTPVRQSRDEES